MSPPSRPFDAQEFLDNAGSLRRLARGLLFDPGGADDVVQEAWLATIEARCPSGYTPRSWLSGWVRNRVRQKHRDEGRRKSRERVAARPELQQPDDPAERLETFGLVVEAVRTLDEPYRSTLLMRFFDDLPPREIARRRGVPVNTVRTHVRRGLELVRGRLEADCKRGRESLLGVLLPLAGPAPFGTALGASAASKWTGTLLMNSKAGLVGLTAIVVALSVVTWKVIGEDEVAPPAAQSEDRAPVAVERSGAGSETTTTSAKTPLVVDEEESRRAAAEQPAAADTDWIVRGTAIDATGAYPDVKVRVRLYGNADASGEPELETVLTTDAEGLFAWPLPVPERIVTVTARGVEEDHLSWTAHQTVLVGDPPPELVVQLYPIDVKITGFVRNEDGEGIPGAHISGRTETTSAEDGSYEIGIAAGPSTVYLTADADGYAQTRVVVEPKAEGANERADFVLRREFAVAGRVVNENGQPLEGATVKSFFTHGNSATTGADGRYRLGSLDPGRPEHMISAEKPGYVLSSENVQTGAQSEAELELVLHRGVEVSGFVIDEKSEPVPGATLYIGFSPNAYDRLDATSDDEGHFVFPAVRRGSQTLVTSRKDLATDTRQIDVPSEGEILAGLEIVLDAGHFVAGTVVDAAGDPMEDVHISVRHQRKYIDRRTASDSEGRFRFEHLPASEVSLEVYGSALVRLKHDVETMDRDDLVLVVQRAGLVAGTVVDGQTGERLPTFRIRFLEPVLQPGDERASSYGATWVREGHLFTDTDGSWDSSGEELPPGSVIGIQASAAGYGPSVVGRVVVQHDPDPESLVIELFPEVRVSGVVVAEDTGAPVEDVVVKRFTKDDPLRQSDSDDVHGRIQSRTDRSGRFELGGIPAGEMYLAVEHAEYGLAVEGPIEIEAGEREVERRIVLRRGGRIEGRLLSFAGVALAGERVTLNATEFPTHAGDDEFVAETDAEGRFSFGPVQDGIWTAAHVWGKDNWRNRIRHFEQRVELTGGGSLEVELRPRGSATLVGVLSCDSELPEVVKASVMPLPGPDGFDPDNLPSSYGVLAHDGRFELSGIEPGPYAIMLHHYGDGVVLSAHQNVTLEESERAKVVVTLTTEKR